MYHQSLHGSIKKSNILNQTKHIHKSPTLHTHTHTPKKINSWILQNPESPASRINLPCNTMIRLPSWASKPKEAGRLAQVFRPGMVDFTDGRSESISTRGQPVIVPVYCGLYREYTVTYNQSCNTPWEYQEGRLLQTLPCFLWECQIDVFIVE